jgi:hypothetical protein
MLARAQLSETAIRIAHVVRKHGSSDGDGECAKWPVEKVRTLLNAHPEKPPVALSSFNSAIRALKVHGIARDYKAPNGAGLSDRRFLSVRRHGTLLDST